MNEKLDLNSDGWIDISVTLKSGMAHWPGDPAVDIKRINNMDTGDKNNLSILSMGAHAGTHMDAPLHFIKEGKGLDEIPLQAIMGKARVIEIEDNESIKLGELKKHNINSGERILFKTRNSERCWSIDDFIEDFVYIDNDGAEYLAEKGVMTVGVDYLSVGGYKKNGTEVHNILLGSGIWLIEGLDLSKISEGPYQLICLPIKIKKSDGAPARAIVKSI